MELLAGYRISAVAQMTGMQPVLLRAWESRYGIVKPQRTPSGYRIYSDEDVALFRGAQQLVRQGLAPMQVARLPRSQLLEAGGGAAYVRVPARAIEEPIGTQSIAALIDRTLTAIASFDSDRVHELVALPLLLMKPSAACRDFVMPLLVELGERWHRREISVAAEHFGTALVRGKLIVLLDTLRPRGAEKRVLCACPPGELHEVGLLSFAIDAAAQGLSPIYLGADVPLDDLKRAAQDTRPDLIAISLVVSRERDALRQLLLDLSAAAGSLCPLLVGGRALGRHESLIQETGCVAMPSSGRLFDLLPALRR